MSKILEVLLLLHITATLSTSISNRAPVPQYFQQPQKRQVFAQANVQTGPPQGFEGAPRNNYNPFNPPPRQPFPPQQTSQPFPSQQTSQPFPSQQTSQPFPSQQTSQPFPQQQSNVNCRRVNSNSGAYSFQCEIIRPSDVTLRYEHVLWLGNSGGAPAVEVVVPNYRVEEIIKAGFKNSGPRGQVTQPINILLQRPEKNTLAEVDVRPDGQAEPVINIQYEPPRSTLVHYPNDQAYRPLSGPIPPPRGGNQYQES